MGTSFMRLAVGAFALWLCGGPAAAAPILGTADPALAGAAVETFDSATPGLYNNATVNDITIQSSVQFAFGTGSNGQYVPPNPSGDVFVSDSSGLIRFSFGFDVSAFGILVGATNFVQTLQAYDSGDNLIESVGIPAQVFQPYPHSGFFGVSSTAANIAYFTVTNVSDGVAFDDLYYTAGAAIPEPGMVALLGLGLAGLACTRRRRA